MRLFQIKGYNCKIDQKYLCSYKLLKPSLGLPKCLKSTRSGIEKIGLHVGLIRDVKDLQKIFKEVELLISDFIYFTLQ